MLYLIILIHFDIAICSFDINESNEILYMPLEPTPFDFDLLIHYSLLFVKYESYKILSMSLKSILYTLMLMSYDLLSLCYRYDTC